ncbi:hypothetical protein [Arthrobacter sp. B1805]|uniref:hypothetical protein n=1 Tax=Arthrobacter sp. B1805 TaxID=2058892 RepID=UPI000CE496AD|nr:hypothetical protein [Arthrobacter sp. B1805]
MMERRKIALGVGAAALVAGASLGVTGMANATTTATPSASASATSDEASGGQGHGGGFGRGPGFDPAGLAEKLGVEESAVTDALQALRDEARPDEEAGGTPDRKDRPDVAASLAEALGLDEATVQTALDDLRTEQQEERSAALQERLDAAVADGSLTQEQADGAAKAVELGILGGHR